jgi:hypothetical protein
MLVFDAVERGSFVDQPPAGPSPGDTEFFTARLRDAAGCIVSTARSTCVFTKMIPNDVLERCTASGKTSEGTLSFGGVGPPGIDESALAGHRRHRRIQKRARQAGLRRRYPVGSKRAVSSRTSLQHRRFKLATDHQLHVGVVPRPAANATFIRHANSACDATERQAMRLPGFPFSTFDPFHPDLQVLPQVGRFFDQPARRRLPRALLAELDKLGQPPASIGAWRNVLKARRAALATETRQMKAARRRRAWLRAHGLPAGQGLQPARVHLGRIRRPGLHVLLGQRSRGTLGPRSNASSGATRGVTNRFRPGAAARF